MLFGMDFGVEEGGEGCDDEGDADSAGDDDERVLVDDDEAVEERGGDKVLTAVWLGEREEELFLRA